MFEHFQETSRFSSEGKIALIVRLALITSGWLERWIIFGQRTETIFSFLSYKGFHNLLISLSLSISFIFLLLLKNSTISFGPRERGFHESLTLLALRSKLQYSHRIRQYRRIERVQLPIHRQIPFESSNYRVANCCGFRAPPPTPSTAPSPAAKVITKESGFHKGATRISNYHPG